LTLSLRHASRYNAQSPTDDLAFRQDPFESLRRTLKTVLEEPPIARCSSRTTEPRAAPLTQHSLVSSSFDELHTFRCLQFTLPELALLD